MQKAYVIPIVVVAAVVAAPVMAAPSSGAYIAAGAGADFVQDNDLNIDIGAGGFSQSVPLKSKWQPGWAISAALGYRWDIGLRAEGEVSYREAKVKAFDDNPWKGTQWDTSFMANVYYDFHTGTIVTPYIGGGIGLTHLSWGDGFRPAGTSITYDKSDFAFGWQAIVGAAFALTSRLEATLDLRYKGADDFRFPANVDGVVVDKYDYRTFTVLVGVRYAL